MHTGTAKLVIDFGNSETRICVLKGKQESGKPIRKFVNISNKFAENDLNLPINEPNTPKNSAVFQLQGTVSGKDVTGTYANGMLVSREYSNRIVRPTAKTKKYRSIVTLMSVHMAFREAYRIVSTMLNVPVNDLDITWDVMVLLPPQDMGNPTNPDSGVNQIKSLVESVKHISFSFDEMDRDIKISSVKVVAEGMCAFTGVVFKAGQEVREDYKYLLSSTVLVIDIGAGTTDFLVVDNMQPIENTKFTVETGGNNIIQIVLTLLRDRKGIKVPERAVELAMKTGTVAVGAEQVSIVDEIMEAKKEVSYSLINALTAALERSNYETDSLHSLMLVGGGSELSEAEGIEPISKYLVERMKEFAPSIGLVPPLMNSKRMIDKETGQETEIKTPHKARMLNIEGAAILAESMGNTATAVELD